MKINVSLVEELKCNLIKHQDIYNMTPIEFKHDNRQCNFLREFCAKNLVFTVAFEIST